MGDQTTTIEEDPSRLDSPASADAAEVVQRYENLVYKVAHQLSQNLPEQIDLQDLIGWGYAGLLEAHQRYDEKKSTRFATYAYYRIRGAILDACPRPVMDSKRRLVEVSCNEVLNTYAHVVHGQECQVGLEDRLTALSDVAGSLMMIYVLRDCPSRSLRTEGAPHRRRLVRRQSAQKIRRIVDELPEHEQAVLSGIYFEGRTMTEIGEQLGYSPSWVSRMHTRALERLRKRIEREDELDDLRHAIPI